MVSNEQLAELLEAQIEASNRTTFAVRALAKYVLYQVGYGLVAGLIIGIGIATGNPGGFIVVGSILVLIGFLHAFSTAMADLGRSEIGTTASEVAGSGASATQGAAPLRAADVEYEVARAIDRLSGKEYRAWLKAGSPDMSSWITEKGVFMEWLERQPKK